MAFSTKMVLPGSTPSNCGGTRRPWAKGTGVISGVTKIASIISPCRVFLHDADGTLRGFRRTGSDGTYSFTGLPEGEYRLVIEDDRETSYRSKVEHVRIGTVLHPPVNLIRPSVSGGGTVGNTLTAAVGSWAYSPTSYT